MFWREEPFNVIAALGRSKPLTSPLFQASVYSLPDLDTLDSIMEGQEAGFFYARDAHPNARLLAEQVRLLEQGEWAVVCSSGMAAVSACVLSLVQAGDRIVASNRLYGKTASLFQTELSRFRIKTVFVDACDLDQVSEALREPTRVLFVETLSNPLLRLVDWPALAKLARAYGATLIVDNTFATPILARPLTQGVPLVIESLTKMMGGHSDVTLGAIAGRGDLGQQMGGLVSTWGMSASPFDCWLAERGLASLELRMRAATANAAAIAKWLGEQDAVERVIYPGLDDHPDHALAQKLLPEGCGNMLCFELAGGRAAVNRFLRQAPEIPFSPSLGHIFTTLSHPYSTSHRYMSPAEKRRQGITEGLVRLSVGPEDRERLQRNLARGLWD